MKAFLSHSSKDKFYVGQVAEELGPGQSEYDEHTFEYTFNVQAIRRALSRSDVFVYFLSRDSITSTFVNEEQQFALEALGRGALKRVLVFCVDDTSYRELPEWLRETNVIQRLTSPKTCARRIQSRLLEIDAEETRASELYVGREDVEKALRRAVSAPPDQTPLAIHVVGHHGIGRRTFLRQSLSKLYPRAFEVFVEVTVEQHQGIEDLFRAIYDLHVVSSLEKTIADLTSFANVPYEDQVATISNMIIEMANNGEFILIVDEGGVYDEEGEYQAYIHDVLRRLPLKRPVLGIAQSRMMPLSRRPAYPRSYHTHLRPLGDGDVKELLSLTLKQVGVDFNAEQLDAVCEHLDGHPYNVRFAAQFIVEYGIDSFIADPADLIEWKRRRAEDFLKKITFSDADVDIVAALSEYRYLATDTISATLGVPLPDVAKSLRRLEDFCCIERRERYYYVSAPLREAVRRDKRFAKPKEWLTQLGTAICQLIEHYKNDDFVSVPILESATIAAARGSVAPEIISALILPSHLLRIARDAYDRGQRALCVDLCRRTYDMKYRLPPDAQIELLRLWGLSTVRLNDTTDFQRVISELSSYGSKLSRRVKLFLEGFDLRVRGRLDDAERAFVAAWKLSTNNQSINREIASLYCKQHRYNEAESYARAAYERTPTNPYIIDILTETLLGKQSMGLHVDTKEVNRLLGELQIYGDTPGSSFYLIRIAQQKAKNRDTKGALVDLARAIDRTPGLVAPYFIRADILLGSGDIGGAERDLKKIDELLTQAGGFSEGEEARAEELNIRILIERQQFPAAKDKIDRSAFLPTKVAQRLKRMLAQAIAFHPTAADARLKEWSKEYFGRTGGRR